MTVVQVVLALFAVVMATFAGGAVSPGTQNVALALITVPVAWLIYLATLVVLTSRQKDGLAVAAAAFPLLYLILAFVPECRLAYAVVTV